ncbi:MAG: PEGA domain-containing protein [Deltaproteobacteria bacterium]|nr:PEGA domain-containing protein [Deltaproteobacteria bacterium]
MRLCRSICVVLSLVSMGLFQVSGIMAQETPGKVKLLPLRVSSSRLGPDDLVKLNRVVTLKLAKYPAYEVLPVPDADPMDLMVDAGCLDFDAECLAGIGADAGVAKVLFTEVNEEGGRFLVQISLVDVANRESMTPEGGTGAREDLDGFVSLALEKVLGPEPVPETVLAKVDISTEPAGAEVYLDKDFVGVSPVTLRLKKGDYVLRMNRVGYKETTRPMTVAAGKAIALTVTLGKVEVAVPVGPVPVKEREIEKKHFYKTWWFWTTIGAVVVAGGVTAGVLATRGGGGSDGSARFTVDPSYAPLDVTLFPTN